MLLLHGRPASRGSRKPRTGRLGGSRALSETERAEQFVFVVVTAAFDRSLEFYRDGLGMALIEEWTEFGHGAVLSAGGPARVELIDQPDGADAPTPSVFLGLQMRDVDEVHGRLVAMGAKVRSPPVEKPWGGRGFVAFDPNGVAVNVYTAYRPTSP